MPWLTARCYDAASNEVGSPVITWVQALGSYLFEVFGRRVLGGKPGVLQERHELGLSLRVHERDKAALLLSLSKHYASVPTSTGFIGKPVRGYKVSRCLMLK